jgi:DNA-binding winged helix-turn-helix (wHTH) protein
MRKIGPRQAEVLEYLILSGRPVEQNDILEQFFPGSQQHSNVRETIRKLRPHWRRSFLKNSN